MRSTTRILSSLLTAGLLLAGVPARAQTPAQLVRGVTKLAQATETGSRVASSTGFLTTRLHYALREHPSLLRDPDVDAYLKLVRKSPEDPLLTQLYTDHPQFANLQPAIRSLPASTLRILEGKKLPSSTLEDCSVPRGSLPNLAAAIENAADEAAATSGLKGRAWVTKIKDQNVAYEATTRAQNATFIRLSREPGKAALYFQTENAALKALNDRYFRDRELSHAVSNLYKRIFMSKLVEDPLLKDVVIGKYADYKSIRLALSRDTPQIRARLDQLYREVATEYAEALDDFPAIRELYRNATRDLVRDERTWHLAGMGHSSDQAAWAARHARYKVDSGITPVEYFDDPETLAELELRLQQLDSGLTELGNRFDRWSEILESVTGRDRVLSKPAIGILRKAPGTSLADDMAFVKRRFQERFDIELSDREAELLLDVFENTEAFAPSIYIENQVIIDLDEVRHGFVAVDLAGQNIRNLQAAQRSLVKALNTRKPGMAFRTEAARTVDLLRAGQDQASETFYRVQSRIMKAIEDEGLIGDEAFSEANGVLATGDDLFFVPASELSWVDEVGLVKRVGTTTLPARYRITFVPPTYAGTGARIPQRMMAQYVVVGEDLEKKIRVAMEGTSSASHMEKVVIAMEVTPHVGGWSTLRLLLGGDVTPQVVQDVRRVSTRLVSQVESVHLELAEIVNTTPK